MTLDPPAAAARRQYVLDRLVEDLVEWGCPVEHAPARAARLLDRVLDAGYALPAAIRDAAPPAPGSSTATGRVRARLEFIHRRVDDEVEPGGTVDTAPDRRAGCACRQWAGDWHQDPTAAQLEADHAAHLAAMYVAAGVATREEAATARTGRVNAGPTAGAGAPQTHSPVSPDPRNRPRAAEGVDR
jgi:hypothetical protein